MMIEVILDLKSKFLCSVKHMEILFMLANVFIINTIAHLGII